MRKIYALVLAVALGAAAYGIGSLAGDGPVAEACPVQAPPPSANVAGTWDSPYGLVTLEQSRYRITGRYQCCGGGTIDGYIYGDRIHFTWKQHGATGKGVWQVRGNRLVGTWGWDKKVDGGGVWNLTRRSPPRVAFK